MALVSAASDSGTDSLIWKIPSPHLLDLGSQISPLSSDCVNASYTSSIPDLLFPTSSNNDQEGGNLNNQFNEKESNALSYTSSQTPPLSSMVYGYPTSGNTDIYILTNEDTIMGLSYSVGTVKPFVCKGCSRRWKGRNGFLAHLATCPKPFVYTTHKVKSIRKKKSKLTSSSMKKSEKRSDMLSDSLYLSSSFSSVCIQCPACYLTLPSSAMDTHFCQQPPPTPPSPAKLSYHIANAPPLTYSSSGFTPSSSISPLLPPQHISYLSTSSHPFPSDSYPSPSVLSFPAYEISTSPYGFLHERDLHWGSSGMNVLEEDGLFGFSNISEFLETTLCSAARASSETLSSDLNSSSTPDATFTMWDTPIDGLSIFDSFISLM